MNNYVLTCKCTDMPTFAKDAMKILLAGEEYEMYVGQQIYDLVDKYANTNFGDIAKAWARNKEKFARLFVVDEDGNVKRHINLKTGAEVC